MKKTGYILFLVCLTMNSCPFPYGYKYDIGTFPSTPVNIEDANSGFDDFNAANPYFGGSSELWFSTNRNDGGSNYDIIARTLDINFNRTDGILTVETETTSNMVLEAINTPYDELGPYFLPAYTSGEYGQGSGQYISFKNYFFMPPMNQGI